MTVIFSFRKTSLRRETDGEKKVEKEIRGNKEKPFLWVKLHELNNVFQVQK